MPRPLPLLFAAALLTSGATLSACGQSGESGATQKTSGHIEKAAGDLTGDQGLQREGRKDEAIGGVKSAVHDVHDSVKDATH